MISVKEVLHEKDLDMVGPYLGQVIDNVDSTEAYRLKIRIYPFFSGVNDTDLPWTLPLHEDKDRLRKVPEVNSWVWCTFKGDHMTPKWFSRKLEATGAEYSTLRTELNAKLKTSGVSTVQYGNYDLLRSGKTILLLNAEGEGVIYIDEVLPVVIIFNKDGVTAKAGKNEFVMETSATEAASGKITITKTGGIKINGSLAGGVSVNDGVIPAPNLMTCIASGAPLCTNPAQAPKLP